jgi:Domain of unknown function (DUF1707)
MTAAGDGSMRAANADRERVVAQLNDAFTEGRLDVGELDERVAAAYAAKTLGELVPLTADLPATGGRAPVRRAAASPTPGPTPDEHHGNRWAPVAGLFGILLVNVLIWGAIGLANGDAPYFWPVWILIPVVFAVIGAIGGSGHDRKRELRQHRQQDRLERRRDRWDDRGD